MKKRQFLQFIHNNNNYHNNLLQTGLKKGDVGMAKHSLKTTGTRDELSITLYLQSEINFCSVRMPVNA